MSWVLDDEVLAVIMAILVVASVLAVAQTIRAGVVVEPFSELGLLGPGKKIADYPRTVVAGEPFKLFVYVGNHEGKTMYYRVFVKFGDRSNFVNASMPMDAEPIDVIDVVLPHNQSTVIPVELVLTEPGYDRRLVFEMWVYDEDDDVFKYYGRWNQLWINVTEPPGRESPPPQEVGLSVYMERTIIEGFSAIREAEKSGGDVREIVAMLNEAIAKAREGDEESATMLVEEIISTAPLISQSGVEKRNRERLFLATSLIATISLGAFSYVNLRKRVWVLWSNLRRYWNVRIGKYSSNLKMSEEGDVIEEDAELKLTQEDRKVLKIISSSGNAEVFRVLDMCEMDGMPRWIASKRIFQLTRKGLVRLVDPNPPATLSRYITSTYGIGFWIVLMLVMATLTVVYASSTISYLIYPRYVLGSLFILFLPGYALIELLYPSERDLTPLERLALSIGLSLALVPLVGLVLNYTPWGIRLDPILASLSILITVLTFFSAARKYSLIRMLNFSKESYKRVDRAWRDSTP